MDLFQRGSARNKRIRLVELLARSEKPGGKILRRVLVQRERERTTPKV